MSDWGLLVLLIAGILAGVQFIVFFLVIPLKKRKKGLDYKINKFIVVFTFLYIIYILFKVSIILFAKAIAIKGGTAFPTCRFCCVLVPRNTKSSGKL